VDVVLPFVKLSLICFFSFEKGGYKKAKAKERFFAALRMTTKNNQSLLASLCKREEYKVHTSCALRADGFVW